MFSLLTLMLGTNPAWAGTNLVVNPGFESADSTGFPTCWEKSGWGNGTVAYSRTTAAHSGKYAMSVKVTGVTTGDDKVLMTENATCAPAVTPKHQYDLGVWYTSTTPNTVVTAFRHDITAGWVYWTDLETLPPAKAYQHTTVRTPAIPPNTDRITWGVTVYGTGTLVTDDYTMADVTVPSTGGGCTAGAACTTGSWQVLPFLNPVRSMHAIVLHNGKVLLMAGSGNDPMKLAAGTFSSAVYDPATSTFTQIATPTDMFCSGHVQLPDGRVLIMSGTKSYPAADGSHGYEGLISSYIFDPATQIYTRVNDMNDGHWYPSATEMGDGDVMTFGGLKTDSSGSVTAERFSTAKQQWLPRNQVNQTWSYFGLYPSMVLMQDGRLFYTGSHVFGNGTSGTGASIYDYNANTIKDVPGLQSKDTRDQSMSVMLPPAQDQRVMIMGGGNIYSNVDAGRQTDLIDLKAASPAYQPGPLLPQGTMSNGAKETGNQGKMYVSTVLLPNGQVFETGGGLHNRQDPVFEASMYDPTANTFTSMATDPIPRAYHSASFLLPDGRVMSVGDNPGDGSFNMHVSIYTPPYLYHGARPKITAVANTMWSYGSSQRITTDSPIVRAELIRPAAVTHSSDPNQRFVDLPLTVNGGGSVNLNVPSNPNLAPPGYYMLFTVNANGVPSVAQWVHLM
ncbi:galactose oxidase-like domain-containing protein [Kitasatospora sp. MAP5-34]|uniref:galactose oxidase-like domain-containing protein n=1 Tax=Kitasatospora sp. MAP5-34 TaxID=3035102 RepID=UPI0024749DB7|nr:galactose oxidase-like domain-containing protein [Kitasatospora sp. MAP5-34]